MKRVLTYFDLNFFNLISEHRYTMRTSNTVQTQQTIQKLEPQGKNLNIKLKKL